MKQTYLNFKPFGVLSNGDHECETTSIRVFRWVENERSTTGKMRKSVVKVFRGRTNDINLIRQAAANFADRLNSMNDTDAAALLAQGPKCQTVRAE